ncbi:accessory Sec system translocase SecA2 [Holdemanella biformis]|uniref:accessory Sec system translocase SecA2 n=1 Tax=Holdemanella biformis TaxID=1735 RepID=UPI001C391786|nr:accessory Sec system translocase SecA2 [Holdemanella biformis]MBV4130643.1 accessory Sec system translocase SecA2 [Holdemanella biformis]MBV4150437.1 accessory Sec system translocase SecA2 [Holdemanella biformis]
MNKIDKRLHFLLGKVKEECKKVKELSDYELKNKTLEFKERLNNGETTDDILPEAFAVCCEADYRVLGMFPYDVQILGGIALHLCYLCEMNTGEGKTLTATMPLYLNGLTGKSSILVTANEYLAIRDAEEMGQVYKFLGLSVEAGVKRDTNEKLDNDSKKDVYNADIVYTTHGSLGFDYLLNNLVHSKEDRFMRDFYFVIIDEADSVLLDSASMPLVISGSPRVQSNLYGITDFFVTTLVEDVHYEIEDKKVWLTKEGVEYVQRYFRIDNLYGEENYDILRHVVLALRAHFLLEKDTDYVVTDKGEVVLLDKSTGRKMTGMKLRGGSHQAIEEKEHVELSDEQRSVASITYQNLFNLFPKMSGMSGTIKDGKDELLEVYHKQVVVIPPNKPLARIDLPDQYFKTSEEQFDAVIKETVKRHETGQPVLLIASLISDTEMLSKLLVQENIEHSVLNANNAFWEAEIIKEAGQKNVVTVATSMAGRGTDIRLGPGVKELGGLCVLGVGRMNNTRDERQARGRAGRQGEPGVSMFYVSLEDDVCEILGDDFMEKYIEKDKYISKRRIKKLVNKSQKIKEESSVFQRKNSVDYDSVMQRQKTIMYKTRNDLLDGMSLDENVLKQIYVNNINEFAKDHKKMDDKTMYRYILDNLSYRLKELSVSSANKKDYLKQYADMAFKDKKQLLGNRFSEYCRLCTLKALDDGWIEEVDYLQQLQAAISGRSTAQRNLLYEYQREARLSFRDMEKSIKKAMIRNILLGEVSFGKDNEMIILYP